MARKKVSKKDKQQEVLQVKPQSTVAYHGRVKIEWMKGDKVYKTVEQHNEGTAELFRYLANALAGNINNTNMPRYIHSFHADNPIEATGNDMYGTSRSTCALNVPFSNVEVRYDSNLDGYNTEYTFMIPYSQIWGSTNILALYNTQAFGDGIIPLAYIRLINEEEQIILRDNNTSNIVIT